MKKVVALVEVYYAGKTHYPGDAFEASDQDAMILAGIGRARPEDLPPAAPAPLQPPTLQPRALQAEDPPPPATPKSPQQPMSTQTAAPLVPPKPLKRKYKRRDMRAED
jgi:hypothetical protein